MFLFLLQLDPFFAFLAAVGVEIVSSLMDFSLKSFIAEQFPAIKHHD